jgi:hypothetical protein
MWQPQATWRVTVDATGFTYDHDARTGGTLLRVAGKDRSKYATIAETFKSLVL